MYQNIVKLMVLAALTELGVSWIGNVACGSRDCSKRMDTVIKKVLKIEWKPISVFPGEAKRFR